MNPPVHYSADPVVGYSRDVTFPASVSLGSPTSTPESAQPPGAERRLGFHTPTSPRSFMSDPVSGSRASSADSAFDPRALGTEACTNETATCSLDLPVGTGHVMGSPAERGTLATTPAPWGLRVWREADTVVEVFLCDEPVASPTRAASQPT